MRGRALCGMEEIGVAAMAGGPGVSDAVFVLPRDDAKVSREKVRECAVAVLENAAKKRRNFTEAVDLQLALNDYDRKRKKKLAGTVKLKHVPRPHLRACVLGHKARRDEAKECGMAFINWEEIKKLKGRPNKIRFLARKYNAFFVPEFAKKDVYKAVGLIFKSLNKPLEVLTETESLADKLQEIKSTTRFRMKRVLTFGMCIGHVKMEPDQVVDNAIAAIDHLMRCLKNDWDNVQFIILKSTMGPPQKLYKPRH
ncbi:large ribosomal subunit protein uL1-like [Amblyomma americanum]